MILLATTSEVVRISRFGIVGIFNTLIDFTIFNVLSSKMVGLSKIKANTISATIAMLFSFFVNRNFVFYGQGNGLIQAIMFLAVTAFGLYILQNGIIYLITTTLEWPRRLTDRLTRSQHIPLESEFLLKNGAKVIATAITLVWNYILYGRVVFRGKS